MVSVEEAEVPGGSFYSFPILKAVSREPVNQKYSSIACFKATSIRNKTQNSKLRNRPQ
jgi:hypothetical protein